MDDPAAEFLARERQELGDLSEELNLQNYSENSESVYITLFTFKNILCYLDGKDYSMDNDVHTSANVEENNSIVEPEKIRKWREEFKSRIELKDKAEQEKIQELEMTANKVPL